jgi:DME family drug/metabolite transporter
MPDDAAPDTRGAGFPSGVLLVAAGAALWATVGVASRFASDLTAIDALSIGFYRLAFAVPPIAWIAWHRQGLAAFRIASRADLAVILTIGIAVAAYQAFYFAAVARAGVAIATLVTLCSAPVLVAAIAAVALGERPGARAAVAGALAVGGTVLLIGLPEGDLDGRTRVVAGALMAIGSAIAYAGFAVASRRLAGRYPPFSLIALGFGAGALVLLPVVLARGLPVAHPPAAWAVLAYMGLVPTALAYVLFYAGLRHVTATVAGVVTLVEPLTATLLARALFGETLGPLGWLGAALLMAGLGVLSTGGTRR